MALRMTLFLGLGRPLSLRSYLSLSIKKRLLQLALEVLLVSLPGIFLILQLLPAPLVPSHEPLQLSALSRYPYSPCESLSHGYLVLSDLERLRSTQSN